MQVSLDREELAGWLRLALTPGVGDLSARRLLAAFGPPGSIFSQTRQALEQVTSSAQAAALVAVPHDLHQRADATWHWLHDAPDGIQRHIAVLGDPAYPATLLAIEDPPLMLYMQGQVDLACAQMHRSVAIVGSRNPTPPGALNARQFAQALSEAGLAVVSGMALGVDGAAHDGALQAQGSGGLATVAVVGTGLDRVYPARHRALAHRIVQRGLIMSEFGLGMEPLPQNFPKRNRIISGLSLGTLVVEAALESGSLITARMALEQGKEVLAIPGSIHSPQSRGCHALIRQGAKLVESAQDVLEELRIPTAATPQRQLDLPQANDHESAEHQGLLGHMGHDPASLDALAARTGLDTGALQAKLLELELDGHVARLPGGLFQRMAMA